MVHQFEVMKRNKDRTIFLISRCLGECIPIRLFLAGYDLTTTMKDVQRRFSVRYFLNLVLVDEEDRRYYKQQVRWPFFLLFIFLASPSRLGNHSLEKIRSRSRCRTKSRETICSLSIAQATIR